MRPWQSRIVGEGEADPRELVDNPLNWRKHPELQGQALEEALDRLGWIQRVVVNKRTGRLIDGHLRVELARRRKEARVPVLYVDLDEEEERLALATLDPLSALAETDAEVLAELLEGVDLEQGPLLDMLADLAAREAEIGAEEEAAVLKGQRPGRRDLPLDLILCYDNHTDPVFIATIAAGWKAGARSSALARYPDSDFQRYPIVFIDNEYADYDHKLHLEQVAKYRPKYATVRDLMTRGQCEEAGIEYYPPDKILEWAEELAQYAENVIVIPKFDLLDEIPEQYVLGYSVPSSYGGTPIPAARFKGRRVHLLGGSWSSQLSYLALLGDDVVSVDHNMHIKLADYGQFMLEDGSTRSIEELDIGRLTNPRMVAVALSAGHIAQSVKNLYEEEQDGETEGAGQESDAV